MAGRAGLGSWHAPASRVSCKVEGVCPPTLLSPSSLCLDGDCLVLGQWRAGPTAASHPLRVRGRAGAWSCAWCLGVPCPPLPPPLPDRCQGRCARSSSPSPSYLLPEAALHLAPSCPLAPCPCGRALPGPRSRPELGGTALGQGFLPSWSLARAPRAATTRTGLPGGGGTCPRLSHSVGWRRRGRGKRLPLHLCLLGGCGGLQRWHHMSPCPPSPALCPALPRNPSALITAGGRGGQMLP